MADLNPKTIRISTPLAGHLLDMLRAKIRTLEENIQAVRASEGKALVPGGEHSVTGGEERVLRLQLDMVRKDSEALADAMTIAGMG